MRRTGLATALCGQSVPDLAPSHDTQADWAKRAATNSRRLSVPSGNPSTRPDQAHLSDYADFNSERNNAFMRDTQKLAQTVIP